MGKASTATIHRMENEAHSFEDRALGISRCQIVKQFNSAVDLSYKVGPILDKAHKNLGEFYEQHLTEDRPDSKALVIAENQWRACQKVLSDHAFVEQAKSMKAKVKYLREHASELRLKIAILKGVSQA